MRTIAAAMMPPTSEQRIAAQVAADDSETGRSKDRGVSHCSLILGSIRACTTSTMRFAMT